TADVSAFRMDSEPVRRERYPRIDLLHLQARIDWYDHLYRRQSHLEVSRQPGTEHERIRKRTDAERSCVQKRRLRSHGSRSVCPGQQPERCQPVPAEVDGCTYFGPQIYLRALYFHRKRIRSHQTRTSERNVHGRQPYRRFEEVGRTDGQDRTGPAGFVACSYQRPVSQYTGNGLPFRMAYPPVGKNV